MGSFEENHRAGSIDPPRQRGRYARAFTLIEVLVVVAIIALLVAVLIPSLKKARDQAKSTACKANLHDFGLAMHQYIHDHDPYYPLPSYIGTTIYYDRPFADDNLFVLWWKKLTRNVDTHNCPATNHHIRTPERVEKVPVAGKGLRFDIYTDGEIRNDFEFHAQLRTELVQQPSFKIVPVEGFGTSYEYMGWVPNPHGKTKIDWYPFTKQKTVDGQPLTERVVKRPYSHMLMKDSDEGYPNEVVGAPTGGAHNNSPEPWDNHGDRLSNVLYADGHAVSLGRGYWDNR